MAVVSTSHQFPALLSGMQEYFSHNKQTNKQTKIYFTCCHIKHPAALRTSEQVLSNQNLHNLLSWVTVTIWEIGVKCPREEQHNPSTLSEWVIAARPAPSLNIKRIIVLSAALCDSSPLGLHVCV